jgi:D-alanine-D-alanine ligase
MRITILTHVDREGSKEYDAVVPQVAEALRAGGHRPSVLGVHGDLGKLVAGLRRRKPDLVFHLLEVFGDLNIGDVEVAGLLDLLRLPYTGGGPAELSLRLDKALAKKVLAFDKIRVPDFAVFDRDGFETGGNLRMPLFVKPLKEDTSIGIDGKKSLVHDAKALLARVAAIRESLGDAALAEEYVEGREFYVGVLGNRDPLALPPIEMDFSGLAPGAPRVLDSKAKWAEGSAEYRGTRAVLAELPDELRARLQQVSRDAYRALKVRDYGRIDLRTTEAGDVYGIEVNANCYLEQSGEFARAAAAAGIDYNALINRIAELALERHRRP